MSNMYGYSDYEGPNKDYSMTERQANEEENQDDPLQAGFWMEGDSLAPPCGTSISTIHWMLDLMQIRSDDVLYDLGCGDGRVCLEAFDQHNCRTIGVEVEPDLVERARTLISRLPSDKDASRRPRILEKDLREVVQELVDRAKAEYANEQQQQETDLPLPTIIILYLLPEALLQLEDQLKELLRLLPPSFRILCNTWGLASLNAAEETEIPEDGGAVSNLFLYTRDSLPES